MKAHLFFLLSLMLPLAARADQAVNDLVYGSADFKALQASYESRGRHLDCGDLVAEDGDPGLDGHVYAVNCYEFEWLQGQDGCGTGGITRVQAKVMGPPLVLRSFAWQEMSR